MPQIDFLIVGQGLAGAALAWQLHHRGLRVLLVDRGGRSSASRVAAGLITPVTGKRLAKSWRFEELYPAAMNLYRWVEEQTGTKFFHQRPALRLFRDELELKEYHKRSIDMLVGLVRRLESPVNADWFNAPLGGFEMPSAARLDVAQYLDATRDYFRRREEYLNADLDLRRDVELGAKEVYLPRFDVSARGLVLCRGFEAANDPWFSSIRFNAAKGEILTLRIPGLTEARVVHRGIWLAPVGGEIFRAGSTYVWDDLTPHPTDGARAKIEGGLREFLRLPYEVIDHQAAVRPVIDAGYPVLGVHPNHPRVAYFNGLGSKGSLLAPYFADQLAGCLEGEREPDPRVDVRRFL